MIEEILKHCRKGPSGRRILTAEQKRRMWKFGSTVSFPVLNSATDDILLAMLYKWRKDSIRGAKMGIQHDGELFNDVDLDAMRKENVELKKALGEAHLDIMLLKKLELDDSRQTAAFQGCSDPLRSRPRLSRIPFQATLGWGNIARNIAPYSIGLRLYVGVQLKKPFWP